MSLEQWPNRLFCHISRLLCGAITKSKNFSYFQVLVAKTSHDVREDHRKMILFFSEKSECFISYHMLILIAV